MTPKEKAQELIDKFKLYASMYKIDGDKLILDINSNWASKKIALIAIDELIEAADDCSINCYSPSSNYWEEVKQELEKL
jgi:hypothetical protein